MKKFSAKAALTQGVGVAAGAVGGSLLSSTLSTTISDPMLKGVGMLIVGAAVGAMSKAGSVVAAAGNGVAAVGAIELAKSYGVISGVGARRYVRRGGVGQPQLIRQAPTIGRDGEMLRDGILGHGSDYNGTDAWSA